MNCFMDGLPSCQLYYMLRADWAPFQTNKFADIQEPGRKVNTRLYNQGLILLQALLKTTGHNWTYTMSRCPGTRDDGHGHNSDLLRLVRSLEKALSNVQKYTDLHNIQAQQHPLCHPPKTIIIHPSITLLNSQSLATPKKQWDKQEGNSRIDHT